MRETLDNIINIIIYDLFSCIIFPPKNLFFQEIISGNVVKITILYHYLKRYNCSNYDVISLFNRVAKFKNHR